MRKRGRRPFRRAYRFCSCSRRAQSRRADSWTCPWPLPRSFASRRRSAYPPWLLCRIAADPNYRLIRGERVFRPLYLPLWRTASPFFRLSFRLHPRLPASRPGNQNARATPRKGSPWRLVGSTLLEKRKRVEWGAVTGCFADRRCQPGVAIDCCLARVLDMSR